MTKDLSYTMGISTLSTETSTDFLMLGSGVCPEHESMAVDFLHALSSLSHALREMK